MLALIASEADRAGTPLSEAEKQMLLARWDPKNIVPEDFRTKAKKLIEQTFDHETVPDNPLSLGNSVEWAGDGAYPTIVALTEEVMLEKEREFPPLRGRRKIIDLVHLVGCGVVAVILMMLVAALLGWLFGLK
jgi:hypothetical protein